MIPEIMEIEYAIIGGGLKEISTAISLAHKGISTAMFVRETYLAHEICTPMLYCFESGGNIPDSFLEFFPEDVCESTNKESNLIVLNPDKFKRHLEKLCDENGVKIIYNAAPIDLEDTSDGKNLILTGKFGKAGIKCNNVMCASADKSSKDRFRLYLMDTKPHDKIIKINNNEKGKELRLYPAGKGYSILEIDVSQYYEPDYAKFMLKCMGEAIDAIAHLKKLPGFEGIYPGRFALDAFDSTKDILSPAIVEWTDKVCVKKADETPGSEKYDLIVAGGGTAGAMAAIHAARRGLKTQLIEMNPVLGGTSTIGGVNVYWFGKRYQDVLEVDTYIQKIYDFCAIKRDEGIWSDYDSTNPSIRAYVLLDMCIKAGVEIMCPAIIYDAIKRGHKVAGVKVCGEEGQINCYAKAVIDATGDGDIAVFSGAKYNYGSKRDMITYWASLAQYTSPDKYKNNFSSTIMVDDALDYTRFIKLSRRRGDTFDHGTYVSPRETRHISGMYEITLKDIVMLKDYDDPLYTSFSNYDPKGKLSADMVYCGVLPPQISMRIPMRALVPVDEDGRRIQGLYIAGKAISATHNAFPGIRMQTDIMHQGAALAIVLAHTLKKGTDPLSLTKADFQKLMSESTGDSLQDFEESMTLHEAVEGLSHVTETEWIDDAPTTDRKKVPPSIAIMAGEKSEALALLTHKYKNTDDIKSKLEISRYLLWHGSDMGTDVILEYIDNVLDGCKDLPERKASVMYAQLLPDHGVMSELVYWLNLLAWSERQDVDKPFIKVLKKLRETERDYIDIRKGIYHYIESFSYVAERTGIEGFIPLIKELLKFEELNVDALYAADNEELMNERYLILDLMLYRALARCADIQGYSGLYRLMLSEVSSVSRSAAQELSSLLGINISQINQGVLDRLDAGCLKTFKIREKVW